MASEPSQPKIVFFRRKTAEAGAFLVYVDSTKEKYCTAFNELEEALDFMEEQERDLGTVCSLFQQVPVE